MKSAGVDRKALALALMLVLASPAAVHAAPWGSIRGNNSAPAHVETHSARIPSSPRAMEPQASRQGTTSRAENGTRENRRGPAEPTGRTYDRNAAPVVQGRGEVHREGGDERERHRQVPVVTREDARDRRRWDIEAERHNAYYWSRFHSGMVLGALPLGYVPLYVSGTPYFYYQGVYYEQGPGGYMVVTPPLGAVVAELPPGAEPIYVGPTVYYYAAGTFYVEQPQGFVVVVPPLGITVPYLPAGAVETIINGQIFYMADGVYFTPVMQDGATVYLTTQP